MGDYYVSCTNGQGRQDLVYGDQGLDQMWGQAKLALIFPTVSRGGQCSLQGRDYGTELALAYGSLYLKS